MNEAMSAEIFSRLFGGRVINKREYRDGALVDNPLFTEIFSHQEVYKQLYRALGFTLQLQDGFYMLAPLNRSDESVGEMALRAGALLQIIARKMASIPLHAQALMDQGAGLARTQLADIGKDDEAQMIMQACGMKGDLPKEVENNLINRDLAFWNHRDALVLSEGGASMFSALFAT